ncbi:MFS transporter [Deinococcus ruber]|uniref:MFS transporter n=1 Tax=Deinococcus ruber TaxID=1848197 RepID=A0A918CFY2_9DEIO|nr:MFS transporter [Deinococcus ruber]GGR23193.1 MFS transporter [Deinococcus ruber]
MDSTLSPTPLEQAERTVSARPDFRRLWAAQSVSLIGSEVTTLALPLTAALVLKATPVQMGLLAAASQAPFLLFSLLAGVWIDHTPRRPWLIFSDVGRAILLLSIPATALLNVLSLIQLYSVAFVVGLLTVFFEVAHFAYVPALLPRRQLTEGNSKIQVSYAAATAAGPGLGGVLVQWLSAPFALLIDAGTFLISAWLLWGIRHRESLPPQGNRHGMLQEIQGGLHALLGHPLLRPIIVASALMTLMTGGIGAVYILYATRELQLGVGVIGLIATAGGLGALPGAVLTRWAAQRFGVGRTIVGGWLGWALMGLAVPLASGAPWLVVMMLCMGQGLGSLADTVANVQQWSLRQVVTPDGLQARVTASHRFLVQGAGALGALLGGFLGASIGLRLTLWVCSLGVILGLLPVIISPLWRLRDMPTAPTPETGK